VERAVEIYAIVNMAVIGLSHAVAPRAWLHFFTLLRQGGVAGVFATAFLNLVFGSIIVAFHNVWTGIPLVLTLLGWANVIKALLYFAFPNWGLRKIGIPTEERVNIFVLPGLAFIALAGLLAYHVATTPA
jgi:hypothetical protein